MRSMNRRDFFRESFGLLFSAGLLKNASLSKILYDAQASSAAELIIARNGTPQELLKAALDAYGGIQKVVKKGQKVVIKVNISFNMPPEYAVTTNPELVDTLIRLCYEAGAGEVLVIDHTIHNWQMCFTSTTMKETVEGAGAKIKAINYADDFKTVSIPRGETLKQTSISKDVLDADVFINVPIAKVHSSAVTTLSMKNLMGIVFDRGDFHLRGLHECIAELSTVVKPDLIILDAYRILMTDGPGGPGEIKEAGEVVVGTDPVAVDVYGSMLLEKDPQNIRYIRRASELGVGVMDAEKITTMYVDAQEVKEKQEVQEPEEPEEHVEEQPETEAPLIEEPEPITEDTGEEKEAGIPAVILIPALIVSFLIGLRMRGMKKKEEDMKE